MRWSVTSVVLFALATALEESSCPCIASTDRSESITAQSTLGVYQQHLLCIRKSSHSDTFLASVNPESLNLNYRIVTASSKHPSGNSNPDVLRECSVLLSIIDDNLSVEGISEKCPGVCSDLPAITIPVGFLQPSRNEASRTFKSCSLSLRVSYPGAKLSYLGDVLRTIASRKLEECYERASPSFTFRNNSNSEGSTSTNSSDASDLKSHVISVNGVDFHHGNEAALSSSRRSVYGLILWIASTSRLKLAEDQQRVLDFQAHQINDSNLILGWIATEDVYPCSVGSSVCDEKRNAVLGESTYKASMPHSFLTNKETPSGWACAQRRPLRALSHVLTLFDPDFLLLVDDDTFVNMKFFAYDSFLSTYIRTTMSRRKIVLGEMFSKKITTKGFYFGGAGYLMGRAALSTLNSYVMHSERSTPTENIRTQVHLANLGVLDEAVRVTNATCTDCIKVRPLNNDAKAKSNSCAVSTADLSVRAVEICMNMMADEGTCYHSDHSVTRCLAYAIYAEPLSLGCFRPAKLYAEGKGKFKMSMCYGGEKCDLAFALTCHRYVATPFNSTYIPISLLNNSNNSTVERPTLPPSHFRKLS